MPIVFRELPLPSRKWRVFLRANRFFLIGIGLLLLFFLYVVLTNAHGDVLIAINGLRTPTWDTVFIIGTQLGEPIAYLVAIAVFLTVRLRTAIFVPLTGIAAGIVTGILKTIFGQARPLRYFADNLADVFENLALFDKTMQNLEYTSFPSGHAASAFALYSFVCFNIHRPKRLVSILCFLLAAEVAVSRMYLLFHFLRDVTAGAFIGVMIGMLMYFLQFRIWPDNHRLNTGLWYAHKTYT